MEDELMDYWRKGREKGDPALGCLAVRWNHSLEDQNTGKDEPKTSEIQEKSPQERQRKTY